MNIIICDDMQVDALKLSKLLNELNYDFNIKIFNNGNNVLSFFNTGAIIDICFLDIVMPDMNGIELAKKLRSSGYEGEIIFITTSNEYAYESYVVKAFSYLLKPLEKKSVNSILNRLNESQSKEDTGGILVKTVGMTRFLRFCDISYIEVMQRKVVFRIQDGSIIETTATFTEISSQILSDKRFTKCHRSFIVNMNAISAIQGKDIIMHHGEKIPISKNYSEAKKRYLEWVFRSKSNIKVKIKN